jgi:microsomal dipeptidase-like Zn-dependent dipeptidase
VSGLDEATALPALVAHGYSEEVILKLLGGNLMRVLRETLG